MRCYGWGDLNGGGRRAKTGIYAVGRLYGVFGWKGGLKSIGEICHFMIEWRKLCGMEILDEDSGSLEVENFMGN